MIITLTDLKKISLMAYIDEKDAEEVFDKINTTLAEAEILKQLDTKNIEPCIHPSAAYQYMRADEVSNDNHKNELAIIAPLFADGNYLVPNILSKGE